MTDRTDAELNAAVANELGWVESRSAAGTIWLSPDTQYALAVDPSLAQLPAAPHDFLAPAGFFEILAECERRGWEIETQTVEGSIHVMAPFGDAIGCGLYHSKLDLPRALAEAFLEACEAGA